MSEQAPIKVENLGKAYRIWGSPEARAGAALTGLAATLLPAGSGIRNSLEQSAARAHRDFWALRDISFEVRRGESIGVIGRNGSGKSTLLQILAGTMQPTTGTSRTHGRVAALLELGSGFNPEFTGRENVWLYAAVLGLSRAEIATRFDAIAAFADIGDFIDQPTKTYSSGMLVRLAFAVAISIDPEVLIVDEALSVGDVFFQQKCFTRIRELLEKGVTFFLVSHDTAAVQNLCSRAILLDHGRMLYMGPPEQCVSRYNASYSSSVSSALAPAVPAAAAPDEFVQAHNLVPLARSRHGDRRLEIIAICLRAPDGTASPQVALMQTLRIEVLVRTRVAIAQPSYGLHLYDRMNNLVFGAGNLQLGVAAPPLAAGATARITYHVVMSVQPGPYTFNVAAGEPVADNLNLGQFYDVVEGLGPVQILIPAAGVWPFYGMANLPMKIEVQLG